MHDPTTRTTAGLPTINPLRTVVRLAQDWLRACREFWSPPANGHSQRARADGGTGIIDGETGESLDHIERAVDTRPIHAVERDADGLPLRKDGGHRVPDETPLTTATPVDRVIDTPELEIKEEGNEQAWILSDTWEAVER